MSPTSNVDNKLTGKDFPLSRDEKKLVFKLRKLYSKTAKLDVEMQMACLKMTESFEHRHRNIYDRRLKLLQSFREKSDDKSNKQATGLKYFWLNVLKKAFDNQISAWDEQVLKHLIDIRCTFHCDESTRFVIEFFFEANDFLSNHILRKTYFMNPLPVEKDPFSFTNAEIVFCEGCQIDWKGSAIEYCEQGSSFFEFFSPPELPDDPQDLNHDIIESILKIDFKLGFYLKEWVIPKAVMFYTGELDVKEDFAGDNNESENNVAAK